MNEFVQQVGCEVVLAQLDKDIHGKISNDGSGLSEDRDGGIEGIEQFHSGIKMITQRHSLVDVLLSRLF